jgi:hypothetical protein
MPRRREARVPGADDDDVDAVWKGVAADRGLGTWGLGIETAA